MRRRVRLVFTTILRHVLTRLLAALIVVLVLSPYTEPFATIHGTDFGRAGAIDMDAASTAKPKPSSKDDVLVAPRIVAVAVSLGAIDGAAVVPSVTLDSRSGQRAILRL